jgi:hypothetical protein
MPSRSSSCSCMTPPSSRSSSTGGSRHGRHGSPCPPEGRRREAAQGSSDGGRAKLLPEGRRRRTSSGTRRSWNGRPSLAPKGIDGAKADRFAPSHHGESDRQQARSNCPTESVGLYRAGGTITMGVIPKSAGSWTVCDCGNASLDPQESRSGCIPRRAVLPQ